MNNFGVNSSYGFGAAGGGGGGGGSVSGGNNGVSLVGANIQLGGNPLLHDSDFDLDDFDLDILLNTNPVMSLRPSTRMYSFGENNPADGSYIELNAAAPALEWWGFGLRGLSLSNDDGLYQMGDIDGSNMVFGISTATQRATIANPGGATFLLLDAPNDNFQIGDLSGTGTGLIVRTAPATASINMGGNNYLRLNAADGLFGIGDLSDVANSTKFQIDDVNKIATIESDGGIGLSIDGANGNYQIGDTSGLGNGTYLEIDDANQLVQISDTEGNSYTTFNLGGKFIEWYLSSGGLANGNFYFAEDGDDSSFNVSITNNSGQQTGLTLFENIVALNGVGGVITNEPNGSATGGAWMFGKKYDDVVVLDTTKYIQIKVDGVLYKLALAQ